MSQAQWSMRTSERTLAQSSVRALGAYYTSPTATRFLAEWALRRKGDRVLEPSMGDGAFLHALQSISQSQGLDATVWGVELARDTYAATVKGGLVPAKRAICDDFLAVQPFEVEAVVGNPPYVRLRHLKPTEAGRALANAESVLGEPMDPSGSIWMPFVLHATQFLTRGGRLALVLPYDLTYVRYARPLWTFLSQRFSELRVIRVHERLFDDILQETVLLLADGFGGTTSHVVLDAFETTTALEGRQPSISTTIEIDAIISGERAFLEALLSSDARALLEGVLDGVTLPARELVTFNIGYVCGDKNFFHPTPDIVKEFRLPSKSLRPALASGRQLRSAGLRTSNLSPDQSSRLFLPSLNGQGLTEGEERYVAYGESEGVSKRYKCRIRDPWYVTPYVKVPDVLVPVFTERPVLLINDAALVASNSLLCGYLKDGVRAQQLASAWFTSLTLLQLELQVHSLGGGVMVLVPREAGNIRLPRVTKVDSRHVQRLSASLLEGDLETAFSSGDQPVLAKLLGLSTDEVRVVHEAAARLAHWRTSVRTSARSTGLVEDIKEEQPALEGFDHAINERVDA